MRKVAMAIHQLTHFAFATDGILRQVDFMNWHLLTVPAFNENLGGLEGWLDGMAAATSAADIPLQYVAAAIAREDGLPLLLPFRCLLLTGIA